MMAEFCFFCVNILTDSFFLLAKNMCDRYAGGGY